MKRTVLIIMFLTLAAVMYSLITYIRFSDHKLHLIFCDVGQGDGILIRTPTNKYITLDGGPDESFDTCLSQHIPFWNRVLSLTIVSHPHADHFLGLLPVFKKYNINRFATENLANTNMPYHVLITSLKKIQPNYLYRGDRFHLGQDLTISVLGPSVECLKRTSPSNMIGESKEFGSLVLLLQYGNFSAVLPGDAQAPQLADDIREAGIKHISVLQSPHHGSASGLTQEIIDQLSPRLAIISVGLKNRYHHPSWQTLQILDYNHIPIKRTDKNGTIEIVSDGNMWQVK